MYVKSVSIEGMRRTKRRTYTFDPSFTYICGPNGSGKSTVLNAVQLALLGYIPGTAKNNSAIMSHASGPELRVSVELDDNGKEVTVTRTFKKKGSSATSSVSVTPDDFDVEKALGNSQLPIFDWSEFVGMTSNKLKDWFVSFVPGMNESIDWQDELYCSVDPQEVRYNTGIVSEYARKITFECRDLSAQEAVQKANKFLKGELSYCKASLQEKESTINGLVGYDDYFESEEDVQSKIDSLQSDVNVSSSTVSELEMRLMQLSRKLEARKSAQDYYESIKSSVPSSDDVSNLMDRIEELSAQIDEKNSQFSSLKDDLDSRTRSIDETMSRISQLQSQLDDVRRVSRSTGTCPYTSSACETILGMKEEYESKESEVQGLIESAKQELESALSAEKEAKDQIDALNREISSLTSERYKAESNVSTMNSIIRQFDRATEVLNNVEEVSGDEVNFVRNQLKAFRNKKESLVQKLAEAKQVLKNAKMIESLTLQKYQLEEKVDILSAWVKLTGPNGLQTTLSSGSFSVLEDKLTPEVQKVFGEGTTCKFNVSTKANSFSFGIDRSGTYIPYNLLSTGEKTLYTFVLMKYISLNSNSSVHLVLMDDFFDHLDSENFRSIVDVIKETSDVQVVVAGVLQPEDVKNDESINVVSLG